MNYECPYCDGTFHNKTELGRHTPTCKWINFASKQRNEPIERRLTDAQKDRLLRDLINKVETMDKQIGLLKSQVQTLNRRKYIKILEWLNKNVLPEQSWKNWLNSRIVVDEKFLATALQSSVTVALKKAIDTLFTSNSEVLPMYSFTQRKNTIYVYDPDFATEQQPTKQQQQAPSTWRILNKNQFLTAMEKVISQLRTSYLQWQMQNMTMIQSSEHNVEQDMENSMKILSISAHTAPDIWKLHAHICDTICRDMEEFVIVNDC